jgi:hypothetical protein
MMRAVRAHQYTTTSATTITTSGGGNSTHSRSQPGSIHLMFYDFTPVWAPAWPPQHRHAGVHDSTMGRVHHIEGEEGASLTAVHTCLDDARAGRHATATRNSRGHEEPAMSLRARTHRRRGDLKAGWRYTTTPTTCASTYRIGQT